MTQLVLSLLTNNAVADGASSNKVKILVADDSGNALSAVAIALSISAGGTVTPTSVLSDVNGMAVVEVVAQTAGDYTITATLSDSTTASSTTTFIVAQSEQTTQPVAVGTTSPFAALKARYAAKVQFIESSLDALPATVKADSSILAAVEADLVAFAEKYFNI